MKNFWLDRRLDSLVAKCHASYGETLERQGRRTAVRRALPRLITVEEQREVERLRESQDEASRQKLHDYVVGVREIVLPPITK